VANYRYRALNSGGRPQQGTLVADSERHARRQLKERGLLPQQVELAAANAAGRAVRLPSWLTGGGRKTVNPSDLVLVLRQQAILLQSGLPLDEALLLTAEQAENPRQRQLVESWRAEITEGRSFSDALRRSPYQVAESVVAAVSVGEQGGHLEAILERVADDLEQSADNRSTLAKALIYPATLVATALLVLSVMMVWVVPKITSVFISSKRELPLVTRAVVGVSEFFQAWGGWLLLLAVLVAIVASWWLAQGDNRRRWHAKLLRAPLAGRWIMMANLADWSRSLGVLLAAGVPILAALKISAAVVSNLQLRGALAGVGEKMSHGSSLHRALGEADLGSGFLVHMVGSGEASSELDKMLLRVSDYYRLRLENAVELFLKLLNPAIIVAMGVMILTIVAAVMLPIMEMNNMV